MRYIGLFERFDLLIGQFHRKGAHRILEVMGFRCAHNWRGHNRLMKQPRQRDLGARQVSGFGQLSDTVHHLFIGLLSRAVEPFTVLIGPRSFGARLRFPGAS